MQYVVSFYNNLWLWAEGIRRLLPYLSGMVVIEKVDGEVMSIIAVIGVVVNIALALVLGVENHVVRYVVSLVHDFFAFCSEKP